MCRVSSLARQPILADKIDACRHARSRDLRKLCLALPEAHEVEAWGEPTFRVRNKMFAMYADADTHHGGGRHAVWLKSTRSTRPG